MHLIPAEHKKHYINTKFMEKKEKLTNMNKNNNKIKKTHKNNRTCLEQC